jgi:hypothetical protein
MLLIMALLLLALTTEDHKELLALLDKVALTWEESEDIAIMFHTLSVTAVASRDPNC